MENLKIFKNEEFGEIRVLEFGNEPWFVGKDIAEKLGYSNTRKAIIDHVDNEDKKDGVTIRDSIGREQTPKALFADAVSASKSSILIGDLAKILKQNGYDTGQKRLFEDLRQKGYLIKRGVSRNMPTQMAMRKGLFEIKETTISNPDGSIRIKKPRKSQVLANNIL